MGSIGIVVPNNEVFVVNEISGLCGPEEVGELIHRGSLVSKGYWNAKALTEQKIKPNKFLYDLIGNEPVVHSGDLVKRDKDGILWFVNRNDEMIKCSGFRISPTEVEDILLEHADISEAVVFGVEDEELGQVVAAAICGQNLNGSKDEIIFFFKDKMPSYMLPKQVTFYDPPFPKTANGKIDRTNIIKQIKNSL